MRGRLKQNIVRIWGHDACERAMAKSKKKMNLTPSRKALAEIQKKFREFSASTHYLSKAARMRGTYDNKWIAIYNGQVKAVADTLDELTDKVEKLDIPSGETLMRYVGEQEMTLIL
jgi:hypothetical protein